MSAHSNLVEHIMQIAVGDVRLTNNNTHAANAESDVSVTSLAYGTDYTVHIARLYRKAGWQITKAGATFVLDSWVDCLDRKQIKFLESVLTKETT